MKEYRGPHFIFILPLLWFAILFVEIGAVRVKRQINFPIQNTTTNQDGCPDRVPCYQAPAGICVEAHLDGLCPQNLLKSDLGFEDVETPQGWQDLEPTVEAFSKGWKGIENCPDCDEPSCQCLESFRFMEDLYPELYRDIEPPGQFPLCDQQSGSPWCFVHRHSECCGDNQQSKDFPQVDISFEACQRPKHKAQNRCKKPCRCTGGPAFPSTYLGKKPGGFCETTFQGDYWCFVDAESCCQLKVPSKVHSNLFWSTEPCNGVESLVNLEDFDEKTLRVFNIGYVLCEQDQDCFAEAIKYECYDNSVYCDHWTRKRVLYLTGLEKYATKINGRGICRIKNWVTCTATRNFCTNPCNTSSCYSISPDDGTRGASRANTPVEISSIIGVGFSNIVGDLFTASGCPSRTMPCRCGHNAGRCCRPLWGGDSRGIFCPVNYPL